MFYEGLTKNSFIEVADLLEGITTTLEVDLSSNLSISVVNSCEGRFTKKIFEPGTYTLYNGILTKTFDYSLNCGSYFGTVELKAENGRLKCTVTENKSFKHDFIDTSVNGVLNFSNISRHDYYNLTYISAQNSELVIKRNGEIVSSGTNISENDQLEVSAISLNEDYCVKFFVVNGTMYENTGTLNLTVTGNLNIQLIEVPKIWKALFEGSYKLQNEQIMTVNNIINGEKTRFSCGAGIINYLLVDGCDYEQGRGNFLTSSINGKIGENGSISISNTGNNVRYGYSMHTVENGVKFSAFISGSEADCSYVVDSAEVLIKKVEQLREPAAYTLTKNLDNNTIVTVKRNGVETTNNLIFEGDELEIIAYTNNDAMFLSNFQVNGVSVSSPYIIKVAGNISVNASSSIAEIYTLSKEQNSNCIITVKKNGIVYNENTVKEGDVLEISVETIDGGVLDVFTVNGINQTSPCTLIVKGNVSIVAYASNVQWRTIYYGSGIRINSGNSYSLQGIKPNVPTKVTMTGQITSAYIWSDCGDYTTTSGSNTENWTSDEIYESTLWSVSGRGSSETAGMSFSFSTYLSCRFSENSIVVSSSGSGGHEYGGCSGCAGNFVIYSIEQYY